MSYIEIKDFSKIIKGNTILDNINLSLEKGKIYGFIGHNGSGKTMLFRGISGLIRATSGQVIVDNKVIGKDIDYIESCGIILETPGFWKNQTGLQCLENIASIKSIITKEEIKKWIKKVGLNPEDKRKFGDYSLGMKQKLALAQAFMESPEIIILDEPTNALDEESVINLRNIIKEEKARGATILIASHNKEDIEVLADKVYKINMGKVKEV